jgi:hypothetical protein
MDGKRGHKATDGSGATNSKQWTSGMRGANSRQSLLQFDNNAVLRKSANAAVCVRLCACVGVCEG